MDIERTGKKNKTDTKWKRKLKRLKKTERKQWPWNHKANKEKVQTRYYEQKTTTNKTNPHCNM